MLLTTLHSFTGTNEGAYPFAGVIQATDGYLYGTTYGRGSVFKISTNGWFTNLNSVDIVAPFGGLVQANDGNLYGTSEFGGTYADGLVFKLTTNGAFTLLNSFEGGYDGSLPYAAPIQGTDGFLYGTTTGNGGICASVFRIGTDGGLTNIHDFTSGGADVEAGLVQGTDGNLYGTTEFGNTNGGESGVGTVFKLSTNGVFAIYPFPTSGDDGAFPHAGLVQGSDGNLYGTTQYGGANGNYGTVFKITTNGALTTLYSFAGSNDGAFPHGGLIQANDGNFYGTTSGQDDSGVTFGNGTVFKISTNGALTTLYSFTGSNDGAFPWSGLIQGRDDSFYGTTQFGGTSNLGTVFKLTVIPPAPPTLQAVILTNTTVILQWITEVGVMYRLQYTTDLTSGSWSNLVSAITATAETLTAIDSVTNDPQRFYRVVIPP